MSGSWTTQQKSPLVRRPDSKWHATNPLAVPPQANPPATPSISIQRKGSQGDLTPFPGYLGLPCQFPRTAVEFFSALLSQRERGREKGETEDGFCKNRKSKIKTTLMELIEMISTIYWVTTMCQVRISSFNLHNNPRRKAG